MGINPVSYTHLDVYKRQEQNYALLEMRKNIILTISHDIRAPLNIISGSAELAMDTREKDVYKRQIYYGLTVNPANGEVYIADAIDYQQQGMIYRYSPEGKLIDEFYVGIIPGAFCWK